MTALERFVITATDEELRRHEVRLHAHGVILCVGAILITFLLTVDVGELTLFIVSWGLSGCQEFLDYAGKL